MKFKISRVSVSSVCAAESYSGCVCVCVHTEVCSVFQKAKMSELVDFMTKTSWPSYCLVGKYKGPPTLRDFSRTTISNIVRECRTEKRPVWTTAKHCPTVVGNIEKNRA